MLTKTFVLLFTLNLISKSSCWIFTTVHFKALEGNFLDNETDITPEDLARLRFSLIYPGTKWCGPGDVADGYDDLGTAVEADKCCREHDYCPDTIPAGETKHNLTNDAYYTRLNCNCDDKFRQCLRDANTKTSKTVGLMYFNVIGTQCYRQDYLITGCIKKGGWLNTKCVEYSYDTNSEKTYQWFDVPNYTGP